MLYHLFQILVMFPPPPFKMNKLSQATKLLEKKRERERDTSSKTDVGDLDFFVKVIVLT